jgi:transcriptional regulator with XRE-family HTH domain
MTVTNPTQSVNQRIRTLMREHKVSQGQLATELRISQQAVSRRLAGDVDFTIGELATVARTLHTPLTELAALAEVSEAS